MATAAAYATAAQSVRPLMQSTAADALYQLESQRIWWQSISKPSTTPALPAVPTAAQIITCPQLLALDPFACAADASMSDQQCGLVSAGISAAVPFMFPEQYAV